MQTTIAAADVIAQTAEIADQEVGNDIEKIIVVGIVIDMKNEKGLQQKGIVIVEDIAVVRQLKTCQSKKEISVLFFVCNLPHVSGNLI